MKNIVCSKCGKRKKLEEFRIYRNSCKQCERLYSLDWNRKNKQKQHKWYLKNKTRVLKRRKEYYQETRIKRQKIAKIWEQKHKKERKIYFKKWKKIYYSIPKNYIVDRLRSRLYCVLKGFRKTANIHELIGCSIEYLIQHLEKKFTKGMTWDHYGKWHVDHIKPCCLFDLSKANQQKKCFNYKNLQPLWAKDNLSKGG